jgi:hypothetical protein
MAQNTMRVDRLGGPGVVKSVSRGQHDFIYRVSTVIDPKWNVGDRVELADGREFVYCLNAGNNALFAAHGCEFSETGYTSYTAFATNAAVGDTSVTVPAATHAALTEDELVGGTILIFDGATDLYTTTRYITGNAAASANAAFLCYLDAELSYAVTSGTSACETYKNPYASIEVASNAAKPKAGVPAAYVPASASYFWCQTKGTCWVAPQSTVNNNEGTGVCWRHDGSIEATATALGATVPDADTTQIAGYLQAGSQAGNGPLIKLVM